MSGDGPFGHDGLVRGTVIDADSVDAGGTWPTAVERVPSPAARPGAAGTAAG
ncbi:hypothetical protein [Saccharothrix yanglingensis]|uniref:hypothetical protein n=1 Tax=Saccharothrix yanglingensis TaxID=659496 RepID=UPI0027D2E4AA|nr:hypothetical protein [Saccharothrix yanglingensis]